MFSSSKGIMSWGSFADKKKGVWAGCFYGSGVGPRGCKHAILWNVSACFSWRIPPELDELQLMLESLHPYLGPTGLCPVAHSSLILLFCL